MNNLHDFIEISVRLRSRHKAIIGNAASFNPFSCLWEVIDLPAWILSHSVTAVFVVNYM